MASSRDDDADPAPRPDDAEYEPVTAWHPMLVALLETFLPAGWKVIPELLLRRLPQRVDILILRLEHEEAGAARKLHSIFDYLRPHTLLEHKGPTDDLVGDDVLVLLGYAFQYMALTGVRDPALLGLMVVADSIPPGFVAQVRKLGGRLDKKAGGLWRGQVCGLALHAVATGEAFQAAPTERLLYTFCRAYLQSPSAILPPLDPEEEWVYLSLYEHVEQFRKKRGSMAMKDEELAKQTHQMLLAAALHRQSPEGINQMIDEDLLRWVEPRKRVAGLAPAERVAGLAPAERVAGLAPAERVAGLAPEEQVLALPDDVLRGLSDDYVRTLSPPTQAAIRARIGGR